MGIGGFHKDASNDRNQKRIRDPRDGTRATDAATTGTSSSLELEQRKQRIGVARSGRRTEGTTQMQEDGSYTNHLPSSPSSIAPPIPLSAGSTEDFPMHVLIHATGSDSNLIQVIAFLNPSVPFSLFSLLFTISLLIMFGIWRFSSPGLKPLTPFRRGDEAVVIERLQQMESNLNSTSRTLLSRMDIKDASNAKKLLVCFFNAFL
ncbi:hypothetical protein LXL04_033779 [Taraxacum kok-saghyz]